MVRVSCLEPLGFNVTDAAKVLGVSRQALSSLLNGRIHVSVVEPKAFTSRMAISVDMRAQSVIL